MPPDGASAEAPATGTPAGAQGRDSAAAGPAAAENLAGRGETTLGALLVLCMFLLACTPVFDYDIWWHLRTGELIWQQGAVPQTDLYTYTDFDRPWVDLHWGFQLLVLGVYRLAGVEGLVVWNALLIAAVVAVGWNATRGPPTPWLRALLWCPAIFVLSSRTAVRPEQLSLLFLTVWLLVIERARNRPAWLWMLPALQVVWINVHAFYILGLIVGGAVLADRLCRPLLPTRIAEAGRRREFDPLVLTAVLLTCGVAALANPYFEEGALFPFVLFRKMSVDHAFYSRVIGEFFPPVRVLRVDPGQFVPIASAAALWLAALASFVPAVRRGALRPDRLLLFAAFSVMGWQAYRNLNLFAVVATWSLCGNLNDWLRLRGADRPDAEKAAAEDRGRRWRVGTTAVLVLLALATVSGRVQPWLGKPFGFGVGEAPGMFAHDAVRFAGQPGFPTSAFVSSIGQAGVYIWHHGPERRVFLDGRLEVVSRQTLVTFLNVLWAMVHADPGWVPLVTDHTGQRPAVILDRIVSDEEIGGMLRTAGWRMVYLDDVAAVFLDDATADRLNLPAVAGGAGPP